MAGVGLTPRRSVAAEDIRDLQSGTHPAGRTLGRRLGPVDGQQRETMKRGQVTAQDHVGRDLRVERRRVDLGIATEDLNQANIGILLEQVGGKTVPQRVRRHPLLRARPCRRRCERRD